MSHHHHSHYGMPPRNPANGSTPMPNINAGYPVVNQPGCPPQHHHPSNIPISAHNPQAFPSSTYRSLIPNFSIPSAPYPINPAFSGLYEQTYRQGTLQPNYPGFHQSYPQIPTNSYPPYPGGFAQPFPVGKHVFTQGFQPLNGQNQGAYPPYPPTVPCGNQQQPWPQNYAVYAPRQLIEAFPAQMMSPQPSLKPNITSCPVEDAITLYKAFKGIGCDFKTVMAILTHRSCEQREEIKLKYNHQQGNPLVERTYSEIYEPLHSIAVALLHKGPEMEAYFLHKETQSFFANNKALVEIICTKTPPQICMIRASYARLYRKNLEAVLFARTSGTIQKVLVYLLENPRDQNNTVDYYLAKQAASSINSCNHATNFDFNLFLAIFCRNSVEQIVAIKQEYENLYKKSLYEHLKTVCLGEHNIVFLTLCLYITNPIQYYAKLFKEGIISSDLYTIIRIVCTRCEIDFGSIMREYLIMYGRTPEYDLTQTFGKKNPDSVDALIMLMGSN